METEIEVVSHSSAGKIQETYSLKRVLGMETEQGTARDLRYGDMESEDSWLDVQHEE